MFQKPRTDSSNDLSIPTLKVHIHRRKSTNDQEKQFDTLKEILSNFRKKRSSIPRVELAYQSSSNPSDSLKCGLSEGRPSSSPISVMLRSVLPERVENRFKKRRLKELPFLKKPTNSNPSEISVSGSSVNYCDWVGILLYSANSAHFPGFPQKLVKNGNSTTTNKSIQKVKRKLFKGRCQMFIKTFKENSEFD
jgi:hypothetical protein